MRGVVLSANLKSGAITIPRHLEYLYTSAIRSWRNTIGNLEKKNERNPVVKWSILRNAKANWQLMSAVSGGEASYSNKQGWY